MNNKRIIQGRLTTDEDIADVRKLLLANPSWSRRRISLELCRKWEWQDKTGRYKDIAARSFLRKLEAQGHIVLPAPRHNGHNAERRNSIKLVPHDKSPIESSLKNLTPIKITTCTTRDKIDLWATFLNCYHYLGYSGPVGKNMKYLIKDRYRRPLACALFGSAAWKTAPRDNHIGWKAHARKKNMHLVANNMRFLILPWVKVPHLASHILGKVSRRIKQDWLDHYAHPVHLLETFVECDRFKGTCYKAANWIQVGTTQGRSRNDKHHKLRVPRKDIYVYPVSQNFRKLLCDTS